MSTEWQSMNVLLLHISGFCFRYLYFTISDNFIFTPNMCTQICCTFTSLHWKNEQVIALKVSSSTYDKSCCLKLRYFNEAGWYFPGGLFVARLLYQCAVYFKITGKTFLTYFCRFKVKSGVEWVVGVETCSNFCKKYPDFDFSTDCEYFCHSLHTSREGEEYLKYGDDGPEQRVKVLAVGDGVAALRPQAELAAEQMHTQNTAASTHRVNTHTHRVHTWASLR